MWPVHVSKSGSLFDEPAAKKMRVQEPETEVPKSVFASLDVSQPFSSSSIERVLIDPSGCNETRDRGWVPEGGAPILPVVLGCIRERRTDGELVPGDHSC